LQLPDGLRPSNGGFIATERRKSVVHKSEYRNESAGSAVQGEQGWSEDDLYKAAVRGNPGASVEAMRRLRESIDKLRTSSDRYATWMLGLTVVLAILTAAQLVSVVEIIRTWVAG
jgi:hypothetical protein